MSSRYRLLPIVLVLASLQACKPRLYKIPHWSSGFTELSNNNRQQPAGDSSNSCAVLAGLIRNAVSKGDIKVWADDGLRYRMKGDQLRRVFARKTIMDTVEKTDKETRKQVSVIIESDCNFSNICRYEIVERRHGSKRYVVVAPVRSMPYFESMEPDKMGMRPQPLFWLRYDDLQQLISNYMAAPYHSKIVLADFADHFPQE